MAVSGPAQPRRTNDPQGLRNRVLDAAAELFQARGYHGATMHEVAAAAGVTGGAMHHHFPSKKALGLAVIRERVAPAVRETWMTPVTEAASASAGVAAVFADTAGGLEAAGAVRGCPLNNLALELSFGDREFSAEIAGVFAEWRRALADKVRADQAVGAADGRDPDAFATLVVSAYSGAMAQAKAAQDARPLRVCAAELARTNDV
jgi:AcrR family transcriptional regulator